jgi:signal transduction histidine kinase
LDQPKEEPTGGDRFFAAISHELRTHLQAIGSAISLLDSGYSSNLPPAARQLLSIATEELDRLMQLIGTVQDMERLTTGQVSLSKSIFPAADLIERSVAALARRSKLLGVSLTGEARDDSTIYGDFERLLAAFTNLALFPLERASPGTEIKLEAMAKGKDSVRLALAVDKGLLPQSVDWMLNKYNADKNNSLANKKWESIQLAIFQSIAEKHGAKIGLESQSDNHSIVWLDLPKRKTVAD